MTPPTKSRPNTPPLQDFSQISRSNMLKSFGLVAGSLIVEQTPLLLSDQSLYVAKAAPPLPTLQQNTYSSIILSTLSDCQLAVSIYPTFDYNALGGGGKGAIVSTDPVTGRLTVVFDPDSLVIPPITYETSKVLGIPIPPPLKIEIKPQKLQGTIDSGTGEAELDFLAKFVFTAGPLYSAPPLVVSTMLTTEQSSGPLRSGRGTRINAEGRAKLVGVARVPKTGDGLLDGFLQLPTDALAVLSAELQFV